MAIQGIVEGWADPAWLGRHVLAVGRGSSYHLVVDGRSVALIPDLETAQEAVLRRLVVDHGEWVGHWRDVTGIVTDERASTAVRQLGSRLLSDRLAQRANEPPDLAGEGEGGADRQRA